MSSPDGAVVVVVNTSEQLPDWANVVLAIGFSLAMLALVMVLFAVAWDLWKDR